MCIIAWRGVFVVCNLYSTENYFAQQIRKSHHKQIRIYLNPNRNFTNDACRIIMMNDQRDISVSALENEWMRLADFVHNKTSQNRNKVDKHRYIPHKKMLNILSHQNCSKRYHFIDSSTNYLGSQIYYLICEQTFWNYLNEHNFCRNEKRHNLRQPLKIVSISHTFWTFTIYFRTDFNLTAKFSCLSTKPLPIPHRKHFDITLRNSVSVN